VAIKIIVSQASTFDDEELRQLRREESTLLLFTSKKCEHVGLLAGLDAVVVHADLSWITSGKLTSVMSQFVYDITGLCSDVIDQHLWHYKSNLWYHSFFSSHMTSHTINYDVICRYLWCHMPLLHTYDIIGHCMWCHRSCNQFIIHDVIAIFVINLIRICANVQNISRDMPMTSHTMTYDVIAHGMWCHRSCNHFVIYDVIAISVID